MKAHDLLWKSLMWVFAIIVAAATVISTVIFAPFIMAGKVYDFFKNNQLARESAQLGAILAIFVALYIILPLVFQNP